MGEYNTLGSPLDWQATLGGALSTRVQGTYVRPTLLHGWASAEPLDRVAKLASATATFLFAALNAVDVASDVAVAVELFETGHPGWGVTSAVVTAFALVLAVAMLLFEKRWVSPRHCCLPLVVTD